MKTEKVFHAFAAIDSKPMLSARNEFFKKEAEYDRLFDALRAKGKKTGEPLRSAFRKAVAPHSVQFDGADPYALNYESGVVSAHLSGEVWPATKGDGYSLPARLPIRFSLSPRNPDEFARIVGIVKAMADAATAGGL